MTSIEHYKAELESVRAAIRKLTDDPTASTSVSSANGGSYSATSVNLTTLYARERELVSLLAALIRGGGLSVSYPIYCGG